LNTRAKVWLAQPLSRLIGTDSWRTRRRGNSRRKSRIMSFLGSLLSGLLTSCLPQQDLVVNGRRLKIIRKLAEGGFSYVYEAKDIRDPTAAAEAVRNEEDDDGDELMAIKLMLSQSPEQRMQIRREIETHLSLATIPHIAPLLDHAFLSSASGGDFLGFYRSNALPGSSPAASSAGHERAVLVFPYYRHGSVQDFLNKRLATGSYLDAATALRFCISIGEALEEVHKRGLAHRDICPRNVMIASKKGVPAHDLALASSAISGTGEVGKKAWEAFEAVLIDFGSAVPGRVEINDRSAALRLVEEASTHSSMPYRAPELFDPPVPSLVDARTDVWSLGATLYAFCFGYSPFESELMVNGTLRIAEPSHLRTLAAVSFPSKGKWGHESAHSEAFRTLITLALEKDISKRASITHWLEKAKEVAGGL
jgi:serine/threonine kinase 16